MVPVDADVLSEVVHEVDVEDMVDSIEELQLVVGVAAP